MQLHLNEPNYSAQVVRINAILPLEGADRLVGIPLFGMQALVSKGSHEVGELGVLFSTESQLSEDFCKNNNLYSDPSLNVDPFAKGYMPTNRRVRAIKLRGHNSNALFMPLSSLAYTGFNIQDLQEGDAFNALGDSQICKKYIIRNTPGTPGKNKQRNQLRKSRIEPKLIPEHVDTDNWWKNEHKVSEDAEIIVTAKLHGTSVRLAHQICDRTLSRLEKVLKWFGFKIQETEYDYFAASRRVVKDMKRPDWETLDHYYKKDLYNEALDKVRHVIPKGYVIYAELIGWSGDAPIQKNYTHRIPQGEFEMYVYRITNVNPDGLSVDLEWHQVKELCTLWGIKHVPEIWKGKKKDFSPDPYMDKKFVIDLGLTQCPPLDDTAPCDEGLVIRVNGVTPYLLKAKAPLFLGHETAILDEGVVDLESLEAEVQE
jgi:RNA ligase